ncbi:MAG: DoxX family protein [Acidobacteriaceae bacterium]
MRLGRVVMGLLYITAGLCHFALTRAYVNIMPDYLPAHRELVLISGAAEIGGGLGVLIPRTRRAAAWGILLLLIVVLPANLWMAQHPGRYPGIPPWILWLRLPLQLPLIWWAYRYTKPETKQLRLSQ